MSDFYEQSRCYLEENWREAVGRVQSNEIGAAWHPNGFMVFRLGDVPSLGRLRLHIWPKGFRETIAGHPPMHCHDWKLASRVLAGVYAESRIELSDESSQSVRVYEFYYSAAGGDCFRETNEDRGINVGQTDLYHESETHYLPAGEFHWTRVPITELVATLVLMSPSDPHVPTVLLGDSGFGSRSLLRPQVSSAEFDDAMIQLAAKMKL